MTCGIIATVYPGESLIMSISEKQTAKTQHTVRSRQNARTYVRRPRGSVNLPFMNEDGSKKRCDWLEKLEK